jgi:hypothetical protein
VLEDRQARADGVGIAIAGDESGAGSEDDITTSSPDKEKVLQLTIRGKGLQQMSLAVKDTTAIRSILRHFLKEYDMLHRLDSAWIEYDGDRVDSAAEVKDLEDVEDDGCCLDVHVG